MESKKLVIIKEIQYWRKNKLLPEQYCLFLLNLYREGENVEEEQKTIEIHKKKQSWKMGLLSILISLGLIGMFFISTYFNHLSLVMQGSILSLATLMLYALTSWLQYKKSDAFHITLGISSIALLATSLWIGKGMELETIALYFILIGVFTLWFLSGVLFHANYLILITLIGFLLSYGWFLHPWIYANHSIWLQHIIWYPIAIVGIMTGLLFLKKARSLGKLLFFSGIVSILAANVHTFFLIEVNLLWSLLFFMTELIIAIVLLFITREKWWR